MIFSVVLRQQRKSDVMTSFGVSARSAVYYEAGSRLEPIKIFFSFWLLTKTHLAPDLKIDFTFYLKMAFVY
jgi:hypothetical protein